MRFLLDTNLFRDRKSFAWSSQHQSEIAISAITIAEIRQGIERLAPGPKRRVLEGDLAELMEFHSLVEFGLEEAIAWGRYVAGNRPVPLMDSLIAATAIAGGLVVATRNPDDFPGVDTFDPTAA